MENYESLPHVNCIPIDLPLEVFLVLIPWKQMWFCIKKGKGSVYCEFFFSFKGFIGMVWIFSLTYFINFAYLNVQNIPGQGQLNSEFMKI